jgi:ribosome recycling factor
VTPGMLDIVDVEAYGGHMKINQLGVVHVVDSHLLAIDLWDKSTMGAVEKAIMASPLGVTPSNDGKSIKVPFPSLTEQRRKDLCKVAGKHAEEAKVSLRNVRRVALEEIKKQQKDGALPEDDARKLSDEIQKLTDSHSEKIEHQLKVKEADIMEV